MFCDDVQIISLSKWTKILISIWAFSLCTKLMNACSYWLFEIYLNTFFWKFEYFLRHLQYLNYKSGLFNPENFHTEISNVSKNVFLCIRYNKMYFRLRNALHYIDNISHDNKVIKQLNSSKKRTTCGLTWKPIYHNGTFNLSILKT